MDTPEGLPIHQERPVSEIRAGFEGPSTRFVMVALAAAQLPVLLVVVVVSIFVPPLRVVAVAWLLMVAALVAFGLRRLRKVSRGQRGRASLILDGSQVRYTDWQGKQITCSRAAVRSATLLLITFKKRTSNLIVFEDDQGAPLISVPYGLFSSDSVDKLASDMGMGALRRRFVNSKAELDAAAPGLQLRGFFVAGNTLFDRFPASRRIVLGFLIAMVAVLVLFVIVSSRS